MKKILFILALVISSFAYGQYKYDVHVEISNANKETINLLDQNIISYDRSISENVITFNTIYNYDIWDIDSIFVKIGVDPFIVIKDRGIVQLNEKIGGTNCEQAEQLCSNASLPGNSSGFGTQELNGTNQGCLAGNEHQSSWYYLNVQTGGILNMRINPSGNADYDFAIWGPFTSASAGANCPPVSAPIRCSFAAGNGNTGIRDGEPDLSEGVFGDRWVDALNVNSNEIYILLIDNFSASV